MSVTTVWDTVIPGDVYRRLCKVKVLICDVDGVLSDGVMYTDTGVVYKRFDTKDGAGMKELREAGIGLAIITGRNDPCTNHRLEKLGLNPNDIYSNQENKQAAYEAILKEKNVQPHEVAYIGDMMSDWQIMKQVGVSWAPKDAHGFVLKNADIIGSRNGGYGAVAELCDTLIRAVVTCSI